LVGVQQLRAAGFVQHSIITAVCASTQALVQEQKKRHER
jgi:hypothetical protein